MPIEVVYPFSRPCLLNVLLRFLFWRPSVCPGLGAAAEASTCQARSSRDSITIGEDLGVRLDPERRRSGILIVKVIVAPPRESPVSLAESSGALHSYTGYVPAALLLYRTVLPTGLRPRLPGRLGASMRSAQTEIKLCRPHLGILSITLGPGHCRHQ